MYQKFTPDELIVDQANNCVTLTFTYDVDEETVNDKTIYITEAKQKIQPMIEMDRYVDGSEVKLVFKDSMLVNVEYELHATKDILSIVGDVPAFEYERTFIVKSKVDSNVKIISPVDYEEQKESIFVKLEEIEGPSKKKFNQFYIEIAADFNFIDILWKANIQDTEVFIKEIDPAKQYYIRARSDTEEEHGNWSKPVTFTYQYTGKIKHDDFEPILEKEFKIIGYPENGVTPKSFILEFPDEIDPDSFDIKDILVLRKKV